MGAVLGVLTALLLLSSGQRLGAQGTAFTYQGVLSQNGGPVTGTNDLLFTLYATNGATLGMITNPAVSITNGQFVVTLDFGANSFSNAPRWLQIAVRPTGVVGGFTTLFPPQTITPSPQAIFAGTAAGVVNGAITAASLSPGVGVTGQVLKMNSGVLTWGTDLNSGGTISNLATGLGLVGGPIAYSGTVSIDTTVVPQLGVVNQFTAGQGIQSAAAASPALVLSGAVGQTASLQQWNNSSGVALANVSAAGVFNGNGSGLTNLNGAAITSNTIPATSIATNQVVKSLNGLMDTVTISPGNNMLLNVNTNTITINTAPGLLSWLVVTGTTQSAQSNKGYLLTNTALATVTLPASPSLADIVRVSGISTNGWMIAQNAGQSILVKNLAGNIGVTWTARDSSRNWSCLAASTDASRLVAAVANGDIYISSNFGATWSPTNGSANWSAVASTADGTSLIAAINGGPLYISTNYGGTWTAHGSSLNWISVASSANAGVLAASTAVASGVYISTDRGNTWTPYSGPTGGTLSMLSDGSKIFNISGGKLYYSTNNGTSWLTNYNAPGMTALAFSSDGSKLVGTTNNSPIYTSPDSGNTWFTNGPSRNWTAVASSSDGTHLAAAVSGGQIYISADSGTTWIAHSTNRVWNALVSSSDGTHLAATVSGGQIYTSDNINPVTTAGTTGYLLGVSNSAVELQYIGNNTFMPLSSSGFVTGN